MTIPFWCLLFATLIPYALTGVGAFCKQREFGFVDNRNPRQQASQLTGMGARAVAAQKNAWEALTVFAVSVMVAHLSGADPILSAWASVMFVIARLLHAYCYLRDLAVARTLSFVGGTASCLWLFALAA